LRHNVPGEQVLQSTGVVAYNTVFGLHNTVGL